MTSRAALTSAISLACPGPHSLCMSCSSRLYLLIRCTGFSKYDHRSILSPSFSCFCWAPTKNSQLMFGIGIFKYYVKKLFNSSALFFKMKYNNKESYGVQCTELQQLLVVIIGKTQNTHEGGRILPRLNERCNMC